MVGSVSHLSKLVDSIGVFSGMENSRGNEEVILKIIKFRPSLRIDLKSLKIVLSLEELFLKVNLSSLFNLSLFLLISSKFVQLISSVHGDSNDAVSEFVLIDLILSSLLLFMLSEPLVLASDLVIPILESSLLSENLHLLIIVFHFLGIIRELSSSSCSGAEASERIRV